VTVIAVVAAVAAALVVALVAWRAGRRRAARRAHRDAVLAATARRIDAAVASLPELDVRHPAPADAAASAQVPVPAVADGLPGRAALVDALAERVAEARAQGSRIAAAVVRSGADDATTLARNVKAIVDAPVYAVGTRSVALVLPGLGRADALGVLAQIEAACQTSGRAVELEEGEGGVELLARLLAVVPVED
jgi:hypothetical protein